MRYEEDQQAAPLQLGDGIEQARSLLGREHRGRLVQRQDARRGRQRAGDLDQLARGDAERAGDGGGVERQAIGLEQPRRVGLQRAPIEQAGAGARLAAEPDVLGDGELGQHRELLVHRRDAGGTRLGRRGEAHGGAVDQDLARARRVHAGEQVHQGRLARAVGPGQGVDLAAIARRSRPLRAPRRRRSACPGRGSRAAAATARARLALLRHFGLNCSGSLLAHQSSGLLISANFAASLGAM